jgi:hypothetical protein
MGKVSRRYSLKEQNVITLKKIDILKLKEDDVVGYLVYRSKTTFSNLICSIKVVSGCFDLPIGEKTSL